ncbi:unnamed protein product [Laminaria digitata]
MPGLHAAAISSQIVQKLGGGTVIGPLLTGLSHAVQIVPINANDAVMVNFATMAAHDSLIIAKRAAETGAASKPKPAAKKKPARKK